MATPTSAQLSDPAFTQAIIAAIRNRPLKLETPIMDIMRRLKPPKFRKAREVHAQRARKLRRRGEYVHFVRWEHGHCIYSWGGPPPQSITFRMHALRR
jgi:hypothetical protein